MATKQLKLRRADNCSVCGVALTAGTEATWDATAKVVICLSCTDASTPRVEPAVAIGVAGASARAKGQALRDQQLARRAKLIEDRPVLGRVAVALAGKPTAGSSWLKGADGEERIGAVLDTLGAEGVLPLHDRRIPKSRANIDHLAITPNGVWVIDPKCYRGKVETINKGGWFNKDMRLVVNGRDQTKLVVGMHKQRAHVKAALVGTAFEDAPVRGALCFVDSEWGLFSKPFLVDGVVVSWGKALWPIVTESGDFDAERRSALHALLAKALPPK